VDYSHDQRFAIREEFEKRQLRHRLLLTIPTALAAAVGLGLRPSGIWVPIALVFVSVANALDSQNWRCPACNSWLGGNWSREFCPNCGVGLADRIEIDLEERGSLDAGSDLQKSVDKQRLDL
jgi:hypothetical protein